MNSKKYITLLVTILIGLNTLAQEMDTLRCNTKILVTTQQKIEELTEQQMIQFLKTFRVECKNNVEFTQFSNEILFNVIQSNPTLFCITIEKYQNYIDLERILETLKNPIHDGINLSLTKEKVEKTKVDTKTKQRIIESLNLAIGND